MAGPAWAGPATPAGVPDLAGASSDGRGVLAHGRSGGSVLPRWCVLCHRRGSRDASCRLGGEGRGTPDGRSQGDHLGGTGLTMTGLESQPAECGALIWRETGSCGTDFPFQCPLTSSIQPAVMFACVLKRVEEPPGLRRKTLGSQDRFSQGAKGTASAVHLVGKSDVLLLAWYQAFALLRSSRSPQSERSGYI